GARRGPRRARGGASGRGGGGVAETGGPGPSGLGREEPGIGEAPPVEIGRHHQGSIPDAGQRPDSLRGSQERDGVEEGVGPDPRLHHEAGRRFRHAPRRLPAASWAMTTPRERDPAPAAVRAAAAAPRANPTPPPAPDDAPPASI